MMKKFALLVASLFLFSCAYTMAISEGQVNRNLAKSFPLEKEYSLAKVELLNPQVKLLGEDEAQVKLNYKLSLPFMKVREGTVEARGRVLYDPKTKTIYLTDLIPLNLKSSTQRELLSRVLKSVGRIPVYRLEGTKGEFVKSIKVERGKILVKLGM